MHRTPPGPTRRVVKPSDIAGALPTLLEPAIAWAQATAAQALATGRALTVAEVEVARGVGVARPEQIRLVVVTAMPQPTDGPLADFVKQVDFLGADTAGLTLGYAVFVRDGQLDTRLLSHECRHVYQYEVAGGIAAYLPVYLQQVAQVGYWDAPFEADARAHEVT